MTDEEKIERTDAMHYAMTFSPDEVRRVNEDFAWMFGSKGGYNYINFFSLPIDTVRSLITGLNARKEIKSKLD